MPTLGKSPRGCLRAAASPLNPTLMYTADVNIHGTKAAGSDHGRTLPSPGFWTQESPAPVHGLDSPR